MGTAELVLNERIVWDSSSLKQVDRAKAQIMQRRREGYEILLDNGKPMERFRPHLEEVLVVAKKVGKKVMKILCDKGDERVVWDKENGTEAKQAKKKFLDLVKKGYKAYSVGADGQKNRRIQEFDVDAEEIIMIPPTAKG